VGGVVVEDHFDGGVGWMSGVEFLEQTDELPRARAIFDAGVNLAGVFSVPAPEPISKFPPTTSGSTCFAAPQRFLRVLEAA
jgi:hypothetical protein